MPECIFCSTALDAVTKPEHVLLNAFGGRLTTRKVICSECNNDFGGTIDKEFAEEASVIRNMLQMPSGKGRPAPSLNGVNADDLKINMRGDGTMKLVEKPFTFEKLPNGDTELRVTVSSLDEMELLIPNIAAAMKVSEDSLRQQMAGETAKKVEKRVGVIKQSLVFGGQEAIRSATKACLVLWALEVGNNEVKSACYDTARDFVRTGGDVFNLDRVQLDSRKLENCGAIESSFGPAFNLVHVSSDSGGRVVGHFTLYNIIAFHIVLAEGRGSPDHRTSLISNPLSPSEWSSQAACTIGITSEWLAKRDYATEDAKVRLCGLVEHYYEMATEKEIARICSSVFHKHGFKDDDEVPLALQDQIIAEINKRVALHLMSQSFEEEVSLEALGQQRVDEDGDADLS